MATYSYICNSCSTEQKWLVFDAVHGMNEKPKIKCPKCGGTNTEKCFSGYEPPIFFIRGNGYLDVEGRRRDMHLWKLQNDDPYKGMRRPGEKDELAASLRKGGKRRTHPTKFYVSKKK